MNLRVAFILFGIGLLVLLFTPQSSVKAQDGCGIPDSTGNVTPCAPEPDKKKPTQTLIPPTFTPTSTATLTSSHIPTSTASSTPTTTALPPTNTSTVTPTATPRPPQGASAWMPGIGIGAFILLLIVGLLLPAVQKIRVSGRGV